MIDRNTHHAVLVKLLKAIYSDSLLRPALGFKGGTAAVLFYGLPRISVDLDFDLLDQEKKELVFDRLEKIVPRFGKVIEAIEKRYTLFYLISYQKGFQKVKVEVSKRPNVRQYRVKQYLGIPMLVSNKTDMVAGKLAAFLDRKKFAARDLFDLWFFLDHGWKINEAVVKDELKMTVKQALKRALDKAKEIKQNQLLQGLGSLLDDKQKDWVRRELITEIKFLLKLRLK
jgi:predicted nucleotidyltransferase component of viral defense system